MQDPERDELDQRIKAALPSVVAEIWTRAQRVGPRSQVTHVQIYLLSGERRYVQITPRKPYGVIPADWSGLDFRAGT